MFEESGALLVAKKAADKTEKASAPTVTVRMPVDLARKLGVVASYENRSAVEVLTEIAQPEIERRYLAAGVEIAKHAKRRPAE